MNNLKLIEKAIKIHETCPPLNYDNLLIDGEVSKALCKSYVKILNLSDQSNVNKNLRFSVLKSIRKICQLEPENHLKVNENITNLIIECYIKHLEDSLKTTCGEKDLDQYLIRILKDLALSSKYQYTINPETVQALLNLNETRVMNILSRNLLHLESRNKHLVLLQSLWNKSTDAQINFDDLSIKLKGDIERTLLEMCHRILTKNCNLEDLYKCPSLSDLNKKTAKSSSCFQICCNILNNLFIETNFNNKIKLFITQFIANVKIYTETISVLYPIHLSHVILLMDIDVNTLPDHVKNNYVQKVVNLLSIVEIECKSDLIMLLSHFPDWFDVYYKLKEK